VRHLGRGGYYGVHGGHTRDDDAGDHPAPLRYALIFEHIRGPGSDPGASALSGLRSLLKGADDGVGRDP
jgi:hypothetical protein